MLEHAREQLARRPSRFELALTFRSSLSPRNRLKTASRSSNSARIRASSSDEAPATRTSQPMASKESSSIMSVR